MTPVRLSKIEVELMGEEGLRLRAYRDSLGLWSIGYGHLCDPRRVKCPLTAGLTDAEIANVVITAEKALELLRADIAAKVADLDRELPWWRELDEVRQRVMIQLAFQLGIGRRDNPRTPADEGCGLLDFVSTLPAIQLGRWDVAAAGLLRSRAARQTPARWKRHAQRMRTGVE